MGDKLKRLKDEMILIYGFNCWLNELWIPNKKDIITYHHIVERRNGGKATLENGALLARSSHDYLNYLDIDYHKIYKELNGLFYDLNRTYKPPTKEYYEEVHNTLKKVKRR